MRITPEPGALPAVEGRVPRGGVKLGGAAWHGRIPYFDPRNANYLIEDRRPALARAVSTEPRARERTRRMHRAMWWGNQGAAPACTAVGTLHTYHCLPSSHSPKPIVDWRQLYALNQTIDREEGRYFAEGATTLAAAKALERLGLISLYEWTYDAATAFNTIRDIKPAAFGTWWYDTMDRRDAEGIIRIGPRAVRVGGHLYCVNGIDLRRGLGRIQQSWGDGYYWIPLEDLARLLGEDGECLLLTETPTPKPPPVIEIAA